MTKPSARITIKPPKQCPCSTGQAAPDYTNIIIAAVTALCFLAVIGGIITTVVTILFYCRKNKINLEEIQVQG